MSVEIIHVSKSYAKQKALDDVSFAAKRGEILGLLGPNGAGKSTTMRIVTGFIFPDSGRVLVNGADIREQETAVRKKIGYLPENNPLYPEMYVGEYLDFVAGTYGLKKTKEAVSKAMEETGLKEMAVKKIGTLSKGYRQRVGIAQAIVHDPEIIIMDEPTSGLDPNQVVDIRALIKDLGKSKTILLSTHILREVELICDRAVVIRKGKVMADQTIETMLQKQGAEQVYQVTFSVPFDDHALAQQPGVLRVVRATNVSGTITVDTTRFNPSTIFEFAVTAGNPIIGLQKHAHDLEDIFKELTS